MPGFIVTIGTKIKMSPSTEKDCMCDNLNCEEYFIEHRTIDKFLNDKFLFDTIDYVYLLDGVVFNNHFLMEKYDCDDWKTCVNIMHRKKPRTFFNEFRGSFLGFVYDKKNDSWLFYTDHIGDKQIFYTHLKDGGWLVCTEMSYMVETMRFNHQKMTPNRNAAYMAVTLGYVIENNTLINEIQKLVPGHYLIIKGEKAKEEQYHRFTNTPQKAMMKEDWIEEIDKHFRNAVRLQFEKDNEYCYKHMTCLSGGLDSRMTVWVAHDLGYVNQLNITFSQSNYLDFQIAQQIATDLHHDFMFKALDGGNCIYDIDVVSRISYGMACFFGLSHTYSMFSKLDYHDYGIVHSGMLGDVILGSYLNFPEYGVPAQISDAAYSIELIDRLKDYLFQYTYSDAEMYMMYNRGFCFCGQGSLAYGHTKTETYSPFCDVDFMELCLSIPLELRCNHKIYKEWILSKYPAAANYIWEKTGKKIYNENDKEEVSQKRHMISLFGNFIPTPMDPSFGEYVKGFVLRRLGLRKKVGKQKITEEGENTHTFMLTTKYNMNPVDYWYYGNPDLKKYMDDYWNSNNYIVSDKQLLMDLTYLYQDCKATYDKLQPLSLIAAQKLIFDK
jgi:asparagine synthase (glutamine-hydrolysing)